MNARATYRNHLGHLYEAALTLHQAVEKAHGASVSVKLLLDVMSQRTDNAHLTEEHVAYMDEATVELEAAMDEIVRRLGEFRACLEEEAAGVAQ
ncbi:MAG: hypothetical protein KatS3mg051_1037 [Anaerolineae bacterium]|nr:MAG: hypothetical protein KatS3mg051_1037 [Anaerolineae bacterium]